MSADDVDFAEELRQRFLAGATPSELLDEVQRRRRTNVLGLLQTFGSAFGLTLSDWRRHCDSLSTHGQTVYYADRSGFDEHMTKCMNDAKLRGG